MEPADAGQTEVVQPALAGPVAHKIVNANIDQIVAEVVRRLTAAAGASRAGVPASAGDVGKGDRLKAELQRGVLSIDSRLVTLDTVDGQLAGLRRLVVPRRAIVTPALRDELAKRGIELDRGGENGSLRRDTKISIVRCHLVRAPLVPGVDDVTATSLPMLIQLVKERITDPSGRVIVLIGQPALAACALNRDKSVRAAQATNVESVRTAARAIAANVLVADPAHLGRVQIAALVRAFENEEVRKVPEGL